jgi:hypothetical protein
MPILANSSHHRKCYRCGSYNHLISKCNTAQHNHKCTTCGSTDHHAKHCKKWVIGKGEDAVEEPLAFTQAVEVEEMLLLDRIMLLEHPDWYLSSCNKCGRKNPAHTELECPHYKMCQGAGEMAHMGTFTGTYVIWS